MLIRRHMACRNHWSSLSEVGNDSFLFYSRRLSRIETFVALKPLFRNTKSHAQKQWSTFISLNHHTWYFSRVSGRRIHTSFPFRHVQHHSGFGDARNQEQIFARMREWDSGCTKSPFYIFRIKIVIDLRTQKGGQKVLTQQRRQEHGTHYVRRKKFQTCSELAFPTTAARSWKVTHRSPQNRKPAFAVVNDQNRFQFAILQGFQRKWTILQWSELWRTPQRAKKHDRIGSGIECHVLLWLRCKFPWHLQNTYENNFVWQLWKPSKRDLNQTSVSPSLLNRSSSFLALTSPNLGIVWTVARINASGGDFTGRKKGFLFSPELAVFTFNEKIKRHVISVTQADRNRLNEVSRSSEFEPPQSDSPTGQEMPLPLRSKSLGPTWDPSPTQQISADLWNTDWTWVFCQPERSLSHGPPVYKHEPRVNWKWNLGTGSSVRISCWPRHSYTHTMQGLCQSSQMVAKFSRAEPTLLSFTSFVR